MVTHIMYVYIYCSLYSIYKATIHTYIHTYIHVSTGTIQLFILGPEGVQALPCGY